MNPEKEKQLKNTFNSIMSDDRNQELRWGYPIAREDEGLELNYRDDQNETPPSRVRTDEELESSVREFLGNNHLADASDITVGVDKSVVTLSGTVKTQEERDFFINAVKLIQGVGDVKSEIIVKRNEGILPTDIGRSVH